jgi:Cu-processing system permease protein
VLIGKYIGLAQALVMCICLGLGSCAGILAWRGAGTAPTSLVWLAGLSIGLALCMLSVGMLVSVLARRAAVAVGSGVFLWLTLVFVTDLGLMAGVMALRMKIPHLFLLSLCNPLQVFKMWSLHAIDASLDVLGPAGLYAEDTYGSSVQWMFALSLAAWTLVPLIAAAVLFGRRSPV